MNRLFGLLSRICDNSVLDYQPGKQKSPLISKNESPSNFQLSNSSLGGESLQEIWGLISDNAVMTPSPGNLHQNASNSLCVDFIVPASRIPASVLPNKFQTLLHNVV